MNGVRLCNLDQDHVTGSIDCALIVIWRNETTVAAAERLRQELVTLRKQHEGGLLMLTVVEQHARMPSPAAREALARILAEAGPDMAGSAVVIEGSGIRGTAVRAVVTALNLIASPPFPHQVFATLEDATVWLLSKKSDSTKLWTQLLKAVASLRAKLS